MKRAGGDCLVLRTGEPPHVLVGDRPHNVARAILSPNALEALVAQIFSESGRSAFDVTGTIEEAVTVSDGSFTLLARAVRGDGHITIELREKQPEPPVAEEAPVPDLPEVALTHADTPATTDAAQDDGGLEIVPSFAAAPADALDALDTREAPVHEIAPPPEAATAATDPQYEELFLQMPPSSPEPGPAAQPIITDVGDRGAGESKTMTWSFAAAPSSPEPFSLRVPDFEEPTVSVSHNREFADPSSRADSPSPEEPVSGLTGWATRAAAHGATALYLRGGTTPMARIDDRLEPLGTEALEAWRFDELVTEFAGGRANGWEPGTSGEWSQRIPGVGLVSCWSFTDDQGAGLMMRVRPQTPSRAVHKMIPRRVRAACDGDGLIVVAAASNSDVAAMAAAVGDLAGRRRGGYVIALRAPGSQRHDIAGAFVSQRELAGSDGEIAATIRGAANESPDVLIVAPPTSEAAMREVVNAADGGRLVVVAVLAPTSMQALRAIVGRASAGGDAQTRLALATSFRAAFAYRVLQRLGGGRTFVRDLVVGTSEVSAMLASGDFSGIARLQREGSVNMTSVDDALARAVRRGHLSLRQAAAHAVDKKYLVGLVRTARHEKRAAAVDPGDDASVLEPVGSARRAANDSRRWSSY